jgi:hypothetical protein
MEMYRGVVNREMPLIRGQLGDEVDKVLIEMGVPITSPALEWTFDEL